MGSAASMLYPTALMLFPHAWFSADSALPGTMVVLSVLTAQAILGFLFWNLRGKLYAGDVGALGAGAVIAVSGLVLARTYSVWVPATLTLPFLVDILLTMAWRARQGGNLFHPHRDHAYQLFLRAGWPHWCVALLWWGFCIVCGVAPVVAIDASTPSDATAFWIFITLCTTGSALWFWQRAVIGGRLKREGL
jgi:UDP-N-acetylmuramyl pentapeptide phosphotransferase/UDP-N-acetylglucosamine-1-phosphate transferase